MERIFQVWFFSLAPEANSDLGCVTDHTHLDASAVGFLRTSDKLVAEAATCTTNTRDEHPCLHRDSYLRFQQSNGHQDGLCDGFIILTTTGM